MHCAVVRDLVHVTARNCTEKSCAHVGKRARQVLYSADGQPARYIRDLYICCLQEKVADGGCVRANQVVCSIPAGEMSASYPESYSKASMFDSFNLLIC